MVNFRLKELRRQANMTQADLSKALCIEQSSIAKYESPNKPVMPPPDRLLQIAKFFGVSVDFLLGNSNIPTSTGETRRDATRIPVLGDVAAGIPIEAITDIVDYEEIDAAKARLSTRGQPQNLQLGTAAAQRSPVAGRYETNQEAKVWILISPTGEEIIVRNLLLWARAHTDLFGKPPGDKSAGQIAAGFRAIASTLTGKRRPGSRGRPAYTYFGWTLKGPPVHPEQQKGAPRISLLGALLMYPHPGRCLPPCPPCPAGPQWPFSARAECWRPARRRSR